MLRTSRKHSLDFALRQYSHEIEASPDLVESRERFTKGLGGGKNVGSDGLESHEKSGVRES